MSVEAAGRLLLAAMPSPAAHRQGTLDDALALLSDHPDLARHDALVAIVTGDADAFEARVDADPDALAGAAHPAGWSPLLAMCFSRFLRLDRARRPGFHRIARRLLAAGADPNDRFIAGDEVETVLYGASGVANDHVLTRLLLEAGASTDDDEAAYHSVEFDDMRCARLLIEFGLTLHHQATSLLHKLDFDDLDGFIALLDVVADPNGQGRWGKTALHMALDRARDVRFVDALITRGAAVDLPRTDGRTPYALAARIGRRDVMTRLVDAGAAVSLSAHDAFVAACAAGDRAAAARLRSEANALGAEDHLMLVRAAACGNDVGVATMLDFGFGLETRAEWGGTALHHAAWHGRASTVCLLLSRGADAEVLNSYGDTALGAAVWALSQQRRGDDPESMPVPRVDVLPVIEALLAGGANPSATRFPSGMADVDALLVRHGAG